MTKIFCESLYESLRNGIGLCTSNHEAESLMKESFIKANSEVSKYNDSWIAPQPENRLYKPALVAVFSVIFDGRLHFAYIGDCLGVLIRNGCRILFAERQTSYVRGLNLTKEKAYREYVNNPAQKRSYGIINGDPEAAALAVFSWFDIEKGDKIILSSDGLSSMLQYERPETLASDDLVSMIPAISAEYDEPPYSTYRDDKTLIDIKARDTE